MSTADGPVIGGVGLGPGHDGRAEMVVEVRYPNGALRRVSLAEEAVTAALDAAGISLLDDLVGRPWTVLLPSAPPTGAAT